MGIRASRFLTVLVGVSAVVAVSGALTGVSAQTGPTGSLTGVMVKARTQGLLPLLGGSRAGSINSLNWSGYVVTPASPVTAVSSTFVVPAAGLVPPGFAATWAGIGGFNSQDLIQAGVGEQSLPDNPVLGPQYFAWTELLPSGETQLSGCTGDPN
ncbi:MAG TPA: G1 family glutamic endopeptidase, partial [Acidimicrobiales bacterium]|nr:G1 family glutamic endopeptidase [Acidimicrobiales bacterium]